MSTEATEARLAELAERDAEWNAPAYYCRECGRAEYVGSPDDFCDGCGCEGPHDSDFYRGRA
jgi:hypothetical protein